MKNEVEIVGVVCQPDRKIGRKQEVVPLAIKQLAEEYQIPVFQPENIIESLKKFTIIKYWCYSYLCLWSIFTKSNFKFTKI